MVRSFAGRLAWLVLIAACTTAPGVSPGQTAGQTAIGGPTAAQLCDAANPASLTALIDLAEQFRQSGTPGELAAVMTAVLPLIQSLQLEPGSEPAQWQAASVDAIEQLQRRIGEPERAPEVARHLVRTVGIFRDQLCP